MTIRKEPLQNSEIGCLIKKHRLNLTDIDKSRQKFIEDRSKKYFNNEEWISEKTLMNIELGKNVPTLLTLKKLAISLEIDLIDLVFEIMDFL